MGRQLFTAADIRARAERGDKRIELAPDDIVTPEAVDIAGDLDIELVRLQVDPLANQVREVVKTMTANARDGRAPDVRGTRVKLVHGSNVELEPFGFDVKRPDMNIRATDVVTDRDGSPMGAGIMSFDNGSFPWTLNYDEIDFVIEGELEIRADGQSYFGRPGDIIFIPRGTSILFCTSTHCRFMYVTYPANWAGQ